jgi:hypothetical protein
MDSAHLAIRFVLLLMSSRQSGWHLTKASYIPTAYKPGGYGHHACRTTVACGSRRNGYEGRICTRMIADWRRRHDLMHKPEVILDQSRPASRFQRMVRIRIALAATVLLCWLLDLKAFDYLEKYAYSLRPEIYASYDRPAVERARGRIRLVTISEKSYASCALPHGIRLRRNYHAQVIADLLSRIQVVDGRISYSDHITIRQDMPSHWPAIQVRAIGTAQIDDLASAPITCDLCMECGCPEIAKN